MALLAVNFYSNVLRSGCSMNVILPQTGKPGFESGPRYNDQGKIPVLWLLHGMGDDRTYWQRYTSVERYVESMGIAVVMPEVLNQSAYADMKHGLEWFTFLSQELPSICRELFPQLSDRREDNYVAGLSMGGYGALKLGLTFPERFAAIGCFSMGNVMDTLTPGIDCSMEAQGDASKTLAGMAFNAFGTRAIKDQLGTENDIYYLAQRVVEKNESVPQIFHCCGTEDGLLPVARELSVRLKQIPGDPFRYRYFESEGAHVWSFWDRWLPEFLKIIK